MLIRAGLPLPYTSAEGVFNAVEQPSSLPWYNLLGRIDETPFNAVQTSNNATPCTFKEQLCQASERHTEFILDASAADYRLPCVPRRPRKKWWQL